MNKKIGILVFIIVLLIVALGIVGNLYLKAINAQKNVATNYLNNLKGEVIESYELCENLNYSSTKRLIDEEENITDVDFSSYLAEYLLDDGKLLINGDKEINLNGAIIQDMRVGTNYDGLYAETFGTGEIYEFTSTLYILFTNGTIGKISTDDIKNENYNITIMSEYKNIEYFIEPTPINHGGDVFFYAVDKESNVYKIDMVNAGA